jgi:hypothetical protein
MSIVRQVQKKLASLVVSVGYVNVVVKAVLQHLFPGVDVVYQAFFVLPQPFGSMFRHFFTVSRDTFLIQ